MASRSKRIPVAVLSGFLGAGKTTILNHLLTGDHGRKIAVIVNDMSEVNVDAQLVQRNSITVDHVQDRLVELSNGCICCTLREDLLIEVKRLVIRGGIDQIVIESTGISEPLPVAETFTFEDEDGLSLGDIAKLDTMVTVVDATRFVDDLNSSRDVSELDDSIEEDDDRSIATLLVEQVEFADLIVLSKCDLSNTQQIAEAEEVVRSLNSGARIVHSQHGRLPPELLLNTDRFDFEQASEHPLWLKVMRGDEESEIDEYGIQSFVFKDQRPFHPQRLWDAAHSRFGGVVRAKGFFWLASRPDFAGEWSAAGPMINLGCAGTWWCATDDEYWPDDDELRAELRQDWHPTWGDRKQELVFIGQNIDKSGIAEILEDCLLTESELKEGFSSWNRFDDPWPKWTPVQA